ncbi:CLUMA_CG012239, isoform A [Clunio marinus]|uniref:CLUMA_CG012239, isoform A n=1 Tax=Clunio marinus TaxID=568069 RepID=A0A1J1IFU6_9DIPT|nr:CLUMA_CG012239, isoform A [Clunio marinus]
MRSCGFGGFIKLNSCVIVCCHVWCVHMNICQLSLPRKSIQFYAYDKALNELFPVPFLTIQAQKRIAKLTRTQNIVEI